jgi:hypothetical protein
VDGALDGFVFLAIETFVHFRFRVARVVVRHVVVFVVRFSRVGGLDEKHGAHFIEVRSGAVVEWRDAVDHHHFAGGVGHRGH